LTPVFTGDALTDVLGTTDLALTGKGVGIAVLDSGVDRHNDLDGKRTEKFWNFVDDADTHAFDDYGHGTHVAGVIGGSGKRSKVEVWANENAHDKEREVAF